MENYELYHYGVPGMKWGVRRSQVRLNRINKKARRQGWSEDAETAAKIKTKKLSQMSNAELKKINERTRLENEYRNLNRGKASAGKKFVGDVTREVGKELAKDYTKKKTKEGIAFVASFIKETRKK